jgi:surfactin synthase thioesterase subunit
VLFDLLTNKIFNVNFQSKKTKLFLLPFAGGNCYSFQFLMPFLKDFEVITVELPGRGQRMGDKLLTNFEAAAQDIYAQVNRQLDTNEPYVFYGHSLGTYLILKATSMLEKQGKSPNCVIVSGNAGPGTDHRKDRHLLEGEDFKAELRRLGGLPEEVLGNKEVFEFFAPIIKSDFEIVGSCDLENKCKIEAPIYAMMGDKETLSPQITNWSNYTKSNFEFEVLTGDHFFIHKHPQKIARVIKTFYDQSKVL